MGFEFKPLKTGYIMEIGGYFNGTKIIKLFDSSGGTTLIEVSLSSNNNWQYISINPFKIIKDEIYRIGVILSGSGGSSRSLNTPFISNNVQVLRSVYKSSATNLESPSSSLSTFYGMVDFAIDYNYKEISIDPFWHDISIFKHPLKIESYM